MSKLLREIDRHSCKLSGLTKAIEQLKATQEQQIARSQAAFNRAQSDNRGSPRLLALGLLTAFAGGVAFGGFIVS
ncbi:MAG: hypothetical protein P8P53_00850 [Tateyamaria sp.]|nr:hypothetical protein [Tateyamaria sp.]